MLFLPLVLFMEKMVATMNAFLFEELYNVGMIAGPSFFIPNGIAVEITCQYGACILQIFSIKVNGFPYLGYILPIRIIRVIGPDGVKGKSLMVFTNCYWNNCSE